MKEKDSFLEKRDDIEEKSVSKQKIEQTKTDSTENRKEIKNTKCENSKYNDDEFYNKSKLVYGIIAGIILVFNIFLLIFGVISYPNGSLARRTFLKGWLIGLLCIIVILALFWLITYLTTI